MDAIDRFGAALVEVGARRSRPLSPTGLRLHRFGGLATRPRGRVIWVAIALLLALAAVAVAATGIFATGTPVAPLGPEPLRPTVGYGTPVVGSEQMLPLAVQDPVGGPPWGARYQTTTRGYGCLQLGRLVGGRLGVIGEDRVFHDDGRFHPLPPGVYGALQCVELDRSGRAYMSFGVPSTASALPQFGCSSGHGSRAAKMPELACPEGDPRILYYGLLGPQAVSVTYQRPDGSRRTVPTVGSLGAYLIVAAPATVLRSFPVSTDDGPIPPIVSVAYRDGRSCTTRRLGGCPSPGYEPIQSYEPDEAQVRSPLSVAMGGPHDATILVSFRARYPVDSAASVYGISVTTLAAAPSPGCDSVGSNGVNTFDRDVRRGQIVRLSYELGASCPRQRLQVQIRYSSRPARAGLLDGTPLLAEDGGGPSRLVGQALVTVEGAFASAHHRAQIRLQRVGG